LGQRPGRSRQETEQNKAAPKNPAPSPALSWSWSAPRKKCHCFVQKAAGFQFYNVQGEDSPIKPGL
jgi:hypothetical protein